MNIPSTTIADIRAAIEPVLAPVRQSVHDIQVETTGHSLEVRFRSTPEQTHYGCMFRLVVDDGNGRIGIDTLLKPRGTERGVGRRLIAAVRDVATQHAYRLFILGPVNGFFWKLVDWRGHVVNRETVEITHETRLADVIPGQSTFSELDRTCLTEAHRAVGRERFAAAHPHVVAEIEAMGPQVAALLGVDYEQQRTGAIELGMKEQALASGIEMFDLLLDYAIDSQPEREQIRQRRRELIAQLLGQQIRE
ncbi:hypothetical protein [Burkholderia sp. Ac-20344]|uniref:hypothetical protein n=1 Tax=Burkholderia sp. Ac-20344 TaxID=2703890 RepID=UPI00197BD8CB|nr:hypothetical protein [Burkholderia sp. Ac-20344]MBN3836313.1 hypothetical protein [Burkholderia sp. Ac-20344]